MSQSIRILSVAALAAAAAVVGIAWRGAASEPQQGAPPSVAAPEHKLLAKYVGTWDAEISTPASAGQPASKSPAKSTCRLTGGGLWLVTDFESTMMGMPFTGHEVLGYDAHARQYVLNWVDSLSSSFSTGELAYDAKSKKLEGIIHGRDMAGEVMTWRQADVWKDDDTREWTMYRKGADGKESVALAISYKRHP